MMFPVCLITEMTINTHIANNLPDRKLRLRFNFPGTFFHFPQEMGNGNYESLILTSWVLCGYKFQCSCQVRMTLLLTTSWKKNPQVTKKLHEKGFTNT